MSTDAPYTIRKRVRLRAPRSKVWHALTDIEAFCSWFGVAEWEGTFEPGARVRMVLRPEFASDDDYFLFVEEMRPESIFSWRWHPGMKDPAVDYSTEPTTLVVFELSDVAEGTELRITESGFNQLSLRRRTRVYEENLGGWNEQAVALERYVSQAP
ncbi:SRPBCC family protein [Povalibacter sp.]|uniref:SRPBCC family protein n=1 Tax=Povalibacter sp. TaxID=1962978 RepID=UPI002F3EF2EC